MTLVTDTDTHEKLTKDYKVLQRLGQNMPSNISVLLLMLVATQTLAGKAQTTIFFEKVI